MNTIEKITLWGDVHHPKWMDILRIGVGVVLFYKGVQFGRNIQDFRALIEGSDFTLWTFFLSHYIPMAHLAGGILIALGLITRWAVVFQVPILIGAVILHGASTGILDFYSQLWFAIVVLAALLLFLVYGSGPFSADAYLKRHPGG